MLLRQSIVGLHLTKAQRRHFLAHLLGAHPVDRLDGERRIFGAVLDEHEPPAGPQCPHERPAHRLRFGKLVVAVHDKRHVHARRIEAGIGHGSAHDRHIRHPETVAAAGKIGDARRVNINGVDLPVRQSRRKAEGEVAGTCTHVGHAHRVG